MILWVAVAGFAVSLLIAALATPITQWMACRWGMLDVPARHKQHARPTPLLGGCAIFAGVLLPSMLVLATVRVWAACGIPAWVPDAWADHVPGAAIRAPAALIILAGAMLLHVVGLIDDRKHLGPAVKLAAQLVVAVGVVLLCPLVRVLTAAGEPISSIVTVLWLVAITNAFNFLDNMDGLSAGVAAICAAALLGAAGGIGDRQLFVAGWAALLLGSVGGFLLHNFPPARSFMGDAGSLVIGYLLAVVCCLTTYVPVGETWYLYGVFVPVVLMALPLYDMVSVIALRLRDRRNPMVGDRRHFSHRLLRRGMTVRKAVLTVYLCTAATAIAASLLPHVDRVGAVLVVIQTVMILLVLALLESGDPKP